MHVETRPKGRPEGTWIDDYVLELAGGQTLGGPFKTQAEAAAFSKTQGHHPPVRARKKHQPVKSRSLGALATDTAQSAATTLWNFWLGIDAGALNPAVHAV